MPQDQEEVGVDDEEIEIEDLTPDDILYIRIRDSLGTFASRQSELLRLADYMDDRAADIDNATERARKLIRAELDDIDESVVDRMVTLFGDLQDADLGDDDLTPEDRQEAIAVALQDVSGTLPDGVVSTYIGGVLRAIHAPPGVGILRSSLLVTLVGELEMLVNYLARACYERQPESLQDSGRQFTWSQIAEYESIDELRDHVVDRAIEDVLRGSLSEWIDYFVRKFKIAPIEAAATYQAQEAIQRRHCIVHNAGLASPLYLERLRHHVHEVQQGDDLEVTAEYLREAADTLYMIAFSLCWAVGFKLMTEKSTSEALAATLANRCYFLLLDRRYSLLQRIGKSVPLAKIDEGAGFVIQVNSWLAFKLEGRFSEVRAEVERLDVTTRSRDFNLAKHALLDEHEDAYRIAQSMIRDESLKPEHFFTWPLLAGVREYARTRADQSPLDSQTKKQLESE